MGVRVRQGREQPGGNRHKAGEERGKVRAPWLVHDKNSPEAGNKSRQEGSLWEGRHGQGQAGKDIGEGVPRFGIEEERLSCRNVGLAWVAVRGRTRSRLSESRRELL